jgi:Domain of unknown function (DUF4198)
MAAADRSSVRWPARSALSQSARRLATALAFAAGVALAPIVAEAHEFWIDPFTFTPAVNATVPIVFRIDSRGSRTPKTLDGDDPATEHKFSSPGLAIVWHRRAPETVVFETMERFEQNLVLEGLETLAEVHRQTGKPLSGIRENYVRCAKALLQVGGPGGNDRAVGLPLELIAEANPYAHGPGQPLPVRLLYAGKPIGGILVKVFNRDDPASPQRLRTDADGRVAIDVARPGEYLVSAVHMLPAKPEEKAHWSSLWASLTFARQ